MCFRFCLSSFLRPPPKAGDACPMMFLPRSPQPDTPSAFTKGMRNSNQMSHEVRIALLTAPSGSGKGYVGKKLKSEGVAVLGHDGLASQCRNMFRPNWKEHPLYGEGGNKHLIWEELRKEHDFSQLLGIIYREWWFGNASPKKCLFEGWILKDPKWRRDAKNAFAGVTAFDFHFEFRLFTLRLNDLARYAEQINKQRVERGKPKLSSKEAMESAKRQQRDFFDQEFEETCDDPGDHEQHDSCETIESGIRRYLMLPSYSNPKYVN